MTTTTDIVKLIDVPERFDAIKTGYKSTEGLTGMQLKNYRVWHKKWNIKTNLTKIGWVEKKKDDIKSFYVNSDKHKESSKRIHLEALAGVLLAINKQKYKMFAKDIYLKTLGIQVAKDIEQENQEATDQEKANYVCFSELSDVRDQLYLEWQSDKKNLNLHNQWLILALNTLLPPLRMDYVDMEFYKGKSPPKDQTNYMWKQGSKFSVVMNADKIESKRGKKGLSREIFDMPTNRYMNGNLMMAMLHDSLDAFPREYLLTSVQRPKEPMSRNSYYSHIKSALKHTGKVPRQNLLRKIYINEMHLFKKPRLTLAHKKDIARRMRHTLATAELNYEKIDVEEMCNYSKAASPEKETDIIKKSIKNIDKPQGFNIKVWSKEYYDANKEEIKKKRVKRFEENKYEILRAKVVRNLNNKTVANPMTATIKKYGLVKEMGEEGVYIWK